MKNNLIAMKFFAVRHEDKPITACPSCLPCLETFYSLSPIHVSDANLIISYGGVS